MTETAAPAIDVIILAGGKGTRLQSVVSDLPKPMAEVNGRPFLDYQLRQLQRSPLVGNVTLALGHLAHKVVEHYGARPTALPLTFVVEESPLGTAGAVRNALSTTTRPLVLVMNGDSLFDLNVETLLAAHTGSGRDATIALLDVPEAGRFGQVVVYGDRVTAFKEKIGGAGPGTINAGVYLFERHVLAALPKGVLSMEQDVLPRLAEEARLTAHTYQCEFIDIGLPETYRAADAFTKHLFGSSGP